MADLQVGDVLAVSVMCLIDVRYQTTPSRSDAGERGGTSHRSSPNFK
jgi:hypothetical protein